MNWRDIRILYARELRSALREPGVVVGSILVPVLLYPLLLWMMYTGFTFVSGQMAGMSSRVVLANLPVRHEALRNRLSSTVSIEVLSTQPEDSRAALQDGTLDAIVEFTPEGVNDFKSRIVYDGSRDRSSQAESRVREAIDGYRRDTVAAAAAKLGVPRRQFKGFSIDFVNLATERQMGQFVLGLLAPALLIVMLTTGGLYPAIDSTAGEIERSTWETLMTAGTARINVILAKYLYVATMSMASALLNLVAMVVSMRAILQPPGQPPGGGGLSFQIPLASIPIVAVGTVLLALFVAACAMTLASFARSFKEGQSIIAPFHVVIVLPLMFIQNPGGSFSMTLAFVPVVNVALMFRDAINGIFRWPQIAVTCAVEVVCVAAALKLASSVLDFERMAIGGPQTGLARMLGRLRRPRAAS